MPLDHEAAHPSLDAAIDITIALRSGIKDLGTRDHGVFLDLEPKGQDGGEGVRELQNAHRAHEAGDVRELRDRGTHHPSDDPVRRDQRHPDEFSRTGGERWGVEQLLEHLDVRDLDANIAIQTSGDQTRDQVHDIGRRLPVVRRETLHHGVVGVLALVGVHEETEEEIHDVDEDIGAEDALPEIPRVAHLREEGDEEHGAAVGVDGLVETVERGGEAGSACCGAVGGCAGVLGYRVGDVEIGVGRVHGREVGRRVGSDAHAEHC